MSDIFPQSGIYMIRNSNTGKYYIGSAVNLERRKAEHFRMLRGGRHHSKRLQNAFNKHGEEVFSFIILARVVNRKSLIQIEQEYIDYHDAAGPRGYNSRRKAESNLGHKFSDEARDKNRRAQLGKKQSRELIDRRIAPLRGRSLSESHKKALSDSKRGCKRPDVREWAPERLSRFSVEDVLQMRADRKSGMTFRAIAKKYKCNESTAHNAVAGVGAFYSGIKDGL